jgi:pimeloyl-ACP methyl ester carboxylesterase
MTSVAANGIEIEYDTFGKPQDPTLLLIMGFGMQLVAWPEVFCQGLADKGFHVVRFDNRDVGLSSKIEGGPPVAVQDILIKAATGKPVEVPYALADMARDAIGLLDGIGVGRAHIVGASMGGMIAQIIAAEYPQRATSLVSIMSTSSDPSLPQAKPEVMGALLAPRATEREGAINQSLGIARVIGSPGFPTPEAELRARIERSFDRCFYPAGLSRQFAAIVASGNRTEMLKRIRVPTLVIHGADDPLVPVEGGKHTAATVPGAKLEIVPGMGHDLAAGLWPILIEMITAHCKAA